MEKSGVHLSNSILILNRLIDEERERLAGSSQLKIQDLQFLLVKSYLQNAAILSQLIEHGKALEQAMNAKEYLKEAAKGLQALSKLSRQLAIGLTWNDGLDIMLDKFVLEITHRDPTEVSLLREDVETADVRQPRPKSKISFMQKSLLQTTLYSGNITLGIMKST